MSINVVIRQKGLPKNVLPIQVILGDCLLYGAFDGVRLIPNRLGDRDFIALDPDHIGRGFSVIWNKDEKEAISMRLPTPSTPQELRAFYDAVARAAAYWHADLEVDGTEMSVSAFLAGYDDMVAFDRRALTTIAQQIVNGQQEDWMLHAAMWPLAMGRNDAKRFLQDPDAYERWLHKKQSVGAYYAAPSFYMTDSGVVGQYVLPCDIRTIYPITPYVPFGFSDPHMGMALSCQNYRVLLLGDEWEREPLTITYDQFLQRIDRTKINGYDAKHFLLEPLSEKEIEALL